MVVRKKTEGISLASVQRGTSINISLTDLEARYLKEIVGFIEGSNLPHAQFLHELFDHLDAIGVGTPESPGFELGEGCARPRATDWDNLV